MGKGKYTVRSIVVRCIVILVGVIITAYGAGGVRPGHPGQ